MSLYDDDGIDGEEDDTEVGGNNGIHGCNFDDETAINGVDDLLKVNLNEINTEDLMRYHFPDLEVAFMFYNWYAAVRGFAARKSRNMRNIKGEITQKTFLCYREGRREEKVSNTGVVRRREPKFLSRCGCEAQCRVHVDVNTGRWYIKYLYDVHNHTMVPEKYVGMLPAHRKMSDYDVLQMNDMRKVGIKTPHIYGYIAGQVGGYENVRFRKQDMYNEQERQKQFHCSDAQAALSFLESTRLTDEMLFWRHTVDGEGRLEHLFWCDGVSRRDYSIFGDVVAFDATYRKNKYMCPLVVFCGINHHNQSIVFASAIVGNETEQTYVWVLEQFLEAMGGRSPSSVITDGDIAMRNAIRRVFPDAHHRLCAWHLLRNATSNVHNVNFVSKLKHCMLGDYDVEEFQRKWERLVADFGLENNIWVKDLYEKRDMWATAHIRGNFFAGFRTTSRCEGLHSFIGKYVNYQNNLLEFLQHFFRCLSYMRYKEVEADFASMHGEPVLQTQFQDLEESAASKYTREVFFLVRNVLQKSCTVRVVKSIQDGTSFKYTVTRYRREGLEWHVTFCQSSLEFKCSCQRLESMGIPCEHLFCVLVFLDIVQLPDCLVLNRWRKSAKDSISIPNSGSSCGWDPALVSQYVAVLERCKRLAKALVTCRNPDLLRSVIQYLDARTNDCEDLIKGLDTGDVNTYPVIDESILNPVRARHKGRRPNSSSTRPRGMQTARKKHACAVCRQEGHNRTSCPVVRQFSQMPETQIGSNVQNLQVEFSNLLASIIRYHQIDLFKLSNYFAGLLICSTVLLLGMITWNAILFVELEAVSRSPC